jgi:hypothetical protein
VINTVQIARENTVAFNYERRPVVTESATFTAHANCKRKKQKRTTPRTREH